MIIWICRSFIRRHHRFFVFAVIVYLRAIISGPVQYRQLYPIDLAEQHRQTVLNLVPDFVREVTIPFQLELSVDLQQTVLSFGHPLREVPNVEHLAFPSQLLSDPDEGLEDLRLEAFGNLENGLFDEAHEGGV